MAAQQVTSTSRCLFTLSNIFLITPWYDFSRNTFYKPTLRRMYGCFLILTKISYAIYALTNNHYKVSDHMLVAQKIIHYSTTAILCFLMVCTQIRSTFLNVANWTTLYKYCPKISTTFFLKQIVFLVCASYASYVWSISMQVHVWKVLMGHVFDLTFAFFLVNFLHGFVETIKEGYKALNTDLEHISKRRKVDEARMRKLAENYRILGETIEVFSETFGYQLILILFHCGLHIVSTLNFTDLTTANYRGNPLYYHCLAANLLVFLLLMHNFLAIVLPMDSTVQEAQKFLDWFHKIQELYAIDSKENQIVTKLTNRCKHFLRQFSAAGFFVVNKGLIFVLVGNVVAYFIIFLQFNECY